MQDLFWTEEEDTSDLSAALHWLSAYREQAALAERLLLSNPDHCDAIQRQLDHYLVRLEFWLRRVEALDQAKAPLPVS